MLQILNPFKAGQEFQKLKSKKKWILALLFVFVPVLLSAVGNSLVQQKNQDFFQQMMEERGTQTDTPPERTGAARGPMRGIMPGMGMLFQGGGSASATQILVLGILISALSVAIFWILKSVVFHIMAKVLGGEGVGMSSTIHVLAYTYIPFVFKGILDVIQGLTYKTPSMMAGSMVRGDSSVFLNYVRDFFNLFVLWALFLMVIAIREQYNLSNKKAALVVLVPYAVAWIIRFAVLPSIGLFGFFGGI